MIESMLSENFAGSASPIAASSVLITVFAFTKVNEKSAIKNDRKIVLKQFVIFIIPPNNFKL